MADLLFVALTCAFTALCVAYIWWCDRIIGPDDFGPDPESLVQTDTAEVTA